MLCGCSRLLWRPRSINANSSRDHSGDHGSLLEGRWTRSPLPGCHGHHQCDRRHVWRLAHQESADRQSVRRLLSEPRLPQLADSALSARRPRARVVRDDRSTTASRPLDDRSAIAPRTHGSARSECAQRTKAPRHSLTVLDMAVADETASPVSAAGARGSARSLRVLGARAAHTRCASCAYSVRLTRAPSAPVADAGRACCVRCERWPEMLGGPAARCAWSRWR